MNITIKYKNNELWMGAFGIVILALLVGCSGKYGSYKRDAEVQQAFEANQVPAEYAYFFAGIDSHPYAIFGVEKKYKINSKIWREVSADTADFQEKVRWIWEDYGYYKFGAHILDPNGTKVGVLYTAINGTSIRFGDDNQISVMTSSPFVWGPDGRREP